MGGIQRIVFTGPESTGKTTLARRLAEYYQTLWVPEYARSYLNQLDRPYERADLVAIAKGQFYWEDFWSQYANHFLFCDTATLVVKIWSEFKYQQVDPYILQQYERRCYNYFFLCDIDLPWEFDPMREHPNLDDRLDLRKRYEDHLKRGRVDYTTLSGTMEERFQLATHTVDRIFLKKL